MENSAIEKKLKWLHRKITMLSEELQAYRDEAQELLLEYEVKYAEYPVGTRVRMAVGDDREWEVRMVRVSFDTLRIWYTVYTVGPYGLDNKQDKATVLGEHLTSL